MAKTRRVIRKTQPNRRQQIDDQLWPLVVAFFVLGGFLAGTVLSYLRLDDPRWYANAWTGLITIPLLIGSALILLGYTGNRLLRRTMQLAIVLCVTAHLVLFIVAVETDVFDRVWTESVTTDRPPTKRVVKIPDYATWQHDPKKRAQHELERLVETETPDPQVETPARQEPTEIELQPQPIRNPEEIVRPDVVKRRRPNEVVPRQREQMSKLSRKLAPLPNNPTQKVQVPDVDKRPEQAEQPTQPQPMGRQLRQEVSRESREPSSQAPEFNQPAPANQIARKVEPPSPNTENPQAAALERAVAKPRIAPRTDVRVADQPAVAQQNQPTATRPSNTAARRQQTRSPIARTLAETPPQEVTVESRNRRRTARQPSPERRSLAQTPRSAPNRQARVTTRPELTSVADNPVQTNSDATDRGQPRVTNVEPARTEAPQQPSLDRSLADRRRIDSAPVQIAGSRSERQKVRRRVEQPRQPELADGSAALPGRRVSDSTAVGATAQRVSDLGSISTATNPSNAATSAIAASQTSVEKQADGNALSPQRRPSATALGASPRAQTARRNRAVNQLAARPSVSAQALVSQPPRRALQEATSASSPTAMESPARVAATSDRATAQAAPAPLVLSKAESGTAGAGASPNLGNTDQAAQSPATIASGAVQRARATQDMPTGPALSPQAAALVRSGHAGAKRPSAILRATPLAVSTLPGSRSPAELNANASASLTQAASNASRGNVTAAKGTLQVDTGTTKLVGQAGAGRASGGGQPQLSKGTLKTVTSRAPLSQSPAPSLLADVERISIAAPQEDGGGIPSPVDLDSNPNAVVASRRGELTPAPGGPRADAGGELRVSSPSSTSSDRRAQSAADAPRLADNEQQLNSLARKATRNRQLPFDAGAVDLNAGNAADHNDDEDPSGGRAAPTLAGDIEKQNSPGATGESSPAGRLTLDSPAARSNAGGAMAARAEAVDAAEGVPQVGGGTRLPTRTGRGPQFAVNTVAENPEMTGSPQSSGHRDAEPRNAQGTLVTRLAGGIQADRNDQPVGALASSLLSEATDGELPGPGPALRRSGATSEPGPAVRDDVYAGGPSRRKTMIQLGTGTSEVDLPVSPSDSLLAMNDGTDTGLLVGSPDMGPVSRPAGPALAVDIDAVEGVGGLGREVTVDVGVIDRRASESSDHVQLESARFVRRDVGGRPDFNTSAAVPTDSFRKRARRQDAMGDSVGGTGPQTEKAIELGLVFLKKSQATDGRWELDRFADQDGLPQLASDTAATGLALLAFQGAGYNHVEHRYADVVRGGIDFLIQHQRSDGCLYLEMDEDSNRVVRFYSHSIAALALCEAYGMTQDQALRDAAQKSLDYIVKSQHQERGGWRYSANFSSDTSVTGWMMMALKSGELANLEVPSNTYQKIKRWLDNAQASESQPHLYCYNPYAPNTPEQRGGRKPTYTMTSVGLLMRLYSGWRRDNAAMNRGARYLLQSPPALGTPTNPRRDTYYWYYATQVMFHMGGQYWNAWNQRLHPLLVNNQILEGELAGSWDPSNPVPDRWAPFAGRLYVTTLNLLSLEVAYRHLPLYEDTAR